MSHHLARLRERFGDALLVRSGRAMALTPRAEAMAGPLREALGARVDARGDTLGDVAVDLDAPALEAWLATPDAH